MKEVNDLQAEYREQIWSVADFLRENLQIQSPVDPMEIVRKLGGVCEKTSPDQEDMNFRDAYIITHNEGEMPLFTIRYSNQMPDARTRFSIAHELGHLCLHLIKSGGRLTQDVRLDRSPIYSQDEAEANEFAAALLMPKDEFVSFCKSYGACVKIDEVAEHFKVSRQAAKVRGSILNLW